MHPRRFPAPWKVEARRESYVVTDALGQHIAYVYFQDEAARQEVPVRLSKDDAQRIARAITQVSALLRRE
jgi:hypothetical protein